jgi:hypothetical protein
VSEGSEGSEDIVCHPLRRPRFQPPAARAPTLIIEEQPYVQIRTSQVRQELRGAPGASKFPQTRGHSVSSDLSEPPVSRCWKVGVAPGQENSRIGRRCVSRCWKVGVAPGQENSRIGRVNGVVRKGSLRPHE